MRKLKLGDAVALILVVLVGFVAGILVLAVPPLRYKYKILQVSERGTTGAVSGMAVNHFWNTPQVVDYAGATLKP